MSMSTSASILPLFDQEMKLTRKVLERVPDGRNDWKPHPKSTSIGALATHLAHLPLLGTVILVQDSHDIASKFDVSATDTTAERLARFDEVVAKARTAIATMSDETFLQPWTLKRGETTIVTAPRVAMFRGAFMNHMIHHRGQMSVYLRLNDVPVPALYGPTADEAF